METRGEEKRVKREREREKKRERERKRGREGERKKEREKNAMNRSRVIKDTTYNKQV